MIKPQKKRITKAELKARITKQEYILNQMNIRCCALEYENRRLRMLLHKSRYDSIDMEEIEKYELAPMTLEEIMKVLERPLYNMRFPSRIIACFKNLELNTVRDLLTEIKNNKLRRVKQYRSIGIKSIKEILDVLQKEGVSDQYNRCYLFQYI